MKGGGGATLEASSFSDIGSDFGGGLHGQAYPHVTTNCHTATANSDSRA